MRQQVVDENGRLVMITVTRQISSAAAWDWLRRRIGHHVNFEVGVVNVSGEITAVTSSSVELDDGEHNFDIVDIIDISGGVVIIGEA